MGSGASGRVKESNKMPGRVSAMGSFFRETVYHRVVPSHPLVPVDHIRQRIMEAAYYFVLHELIEGDDQLGLEFLNHVHCRL